MYLDILAMLTYDGAIQKGVGEAISDSLSTTSSAILYDRARGTACIFTCHDELHQFQSPKMELLVQRVTKYYQLLYHTTVIRQKAYCISET